jgi:hypothetical protein
MPAGRVTRLRNGLLRGDRHRWTLVVDSHRRLFAVRPLTEADGSSSGSTGMGPERHLMVRAQGTLCGWLSGLPEAASWVTR